MQMQEMLGKVFTEVINDTDHDRLVFICDEGEFVMQHQQDCCEHVYVEDIVGNLEDLVGSPILIAEESSQDDDKAYDVGAWTFYKLATIKGYVDIRWYGSSNGYYSIGVGLDFYPN